MFSITTFVEGRPLKITSWLTLSLFSWVFYLSPNAFAVNDLATKEDKRQAAIEQALDRNPEQAYGRRLQLLKDRLTIDLPREKAAAKAAQQKTFTGRAQQLLNKAGLFLPEVLSSEQRDEFIKLRTEINALQTQSDAGFIEVENHIRAKKLPAIVLKRHQAMVKQSRKSLATFNQRMDALLNATDAKAQQQALNALTAFMQKQQFGKTPDITNLKKLPFGNPDKKVRKPMTDSLAMQRYLGIQPVMVASLTTKGLLENTKTPTPADLAENIEIQLTDAIKAKATELHHNPVEIYTWVHNNVQFIPSYGSIQGADYTLQTLKGNSFDTASLLIALLRASGIPARYAFGTIEVPLDKLNNWVGGVDNFWAATNILGQGGIPHTLIKMNGQFTSVHMEHVWVEAFVDFEPSRGVNNVKGDNWIPMDASYKQYDFTPGMDIQNNVAFNADALVQSINASATVNESEGWVQNLPQADIEQQLTAFQTQVQTYIESQNPDATLGEVLGLQQVKVREPQPLAAGLPYKPVTAKQTFSVMPANLRHTFTYTLAQSDSAAALDTYLITIKRSLPELAGKKLALSYKPASASDEAIILSYIPDVPAGQTLDPAQLPQSLPGYLINMVAEFTINGEVVASAPAGKLGTEVRDGFQMIKPTGDQFPETSNHIIVGQYHAIGLDLQSLSATQLQQLQTELNTTKTALEAAQTDTTALSSLTKHAVVGDLLQATVQSYFAMNDIQNQLMAQAGKGKIYRMPSYGKFSTNLDIIYKWGVPQTVKFSGMMMDMDFMLSIIGNNKNDAAQQKALVQQVSMVNSAIEHLVPEQMFSTPENPAYGVSAVKALQLAAAEGQKIYRITQSNVDTALAAINLNSSTEQEIRDAIYAGKEVTTHTHKINYQGMIVAGYVIEDPTNGTGAYKIASGEDGAKFDWVGTISTFSTDFGLLALDISFSAILLPSLTPIAIAMGAVALILTAASGSYSCNNILYSGESFSLYSIIIALSAFAFIGSISLWLYPFLFASTMLRIYEIELALADTFSYSLGLFFYPIACKK